MWKLFIVAVLSAAAGALASHHLWPRAAVASLPPTQPADPPRPLTKEEQAMKIALEWQQALVGDDVSKMTRLMDVPWYGLHRIEPKTGIVRDWKTVVNFWIERNHILRQSSLRQKSPDITAAWARPWDEVKGLNHPDSETLGGEVWCVGLVHEKSSVDRILVRFKGDQVKVIGDAGP